MIPHNTLAVFRFELRRTLTASRIGVWLLLVLFPVFIVSAMKYYEDSFAGTLFGKPSRAEPTIGSESLRITLTVKHGKRVVTIEMGQDSEAVVLRDVPVPNNVSPSEIRRWCRQVVVQSEQWQRIHRNTRAKPEKVDDTVWGAVLFGLIPEVITLFGLLLWVTPVVQSELEGRTWIYLAVRPRGRASLLLGKYFTAITWTALAGWTSATICILVTQPEESLRLWLALLIVIALACIGYGALYSLIGVAIQRRAMVIAVAYTLVFEFLISFIPAVINQFTVQYRLRNVFVDFMDWRKLLENETSLILLGDQPAWLHVLILGAFTVFLLVIAVQVIQRKEYVSADEA